MYGFYYFSVQGNFKSINNRGQEENAKELFLTESASFYDAETTVSELLKETTQFPDTIDIPKINRMDKVKNLLYSDILQVDKSEKKGYMEYSIDKENGVILFSAKVQFEEISGNKTKTITEIYLVPAKTTSEVERHLKAHLKDSVFDYKIPDVNGTKFDTILVLEETHRNLVKDYDLIKNRL